MNLFDLNDKIYGAKNLGQGKNINFMIESREQQEILNNNLNAYHYEDTISNFYSSDKEIKF